MTTSEVRAMEVIAEQCGASVYRDELCSVANWVVATSPIYSSRVKVIWRDGGYLIAESALRDWAKDCKEALGESRHCRARP